MKKIISIILALACTLTCAFALASCGENETAHALHVDADLDGYCDECEAADLDGDGVYVIYDTVADSTTKCAVCDDADLDGNCDVCGSRVNTPGRVIFKMILDSDPSTIKTIDQVSIAGVSYERVYTTYIYSESSFKHTVTGKRPASIYDDTEDDFVPVNETVTYSNGVYTVNGVVTAGAPEVSYLGVQRAITPKNVPNPTFSNGGKTMKATLSAADCEAIFGISVDASEINLTIDTNGVRLHMITLSYTDVNGTIVTSTTSYSYAPVTAEE